MKKFFPHLIFIAFSVLLVYKGNAQEGGIIQGKVTDQNKKPISGIGTNPLSVLLCARTTTSSRPPAVVFIEILNTVLLAMGNFKLSIPI